MKIVLHICTSVFILLFAAPLVYSCSCFAISNLEEVKTTDAVFTGKVIEIAEDKSYIPPENKNKPSVRNAGTAEFPIWVNNIIGVKRFLVKFKVDKRFKGAEEHEITLVQYVRELSVCSELIFEKGKKYLIYASKVSNELMNRGCARTQIFDKKSKDYKELAKLKKRNQIE